MPTIFTHPAVPLAIGIGLGRARVSGRLLCAGIAASIIPDLDGIGFRLGVPYGSILGHRGFTHSLAFAVALGLVAMLFRRGLRSTSLAAFLFVAGSAASHGLLDMLTNGGRGVAYLWPLSSERLFFPVRPIEVSPLTLQRVIEDASRVFGSELAWVWLPCTVLCVALYLRREVHARH